MQCNAIQCQTNISSSSSSSSTVISSSISFITIITFVS